MVYVYGVNFCIIDIVCLGYMALIGKYITIEHLLIIPYPLNFFVCETFLSLQMRLPYLTL